MRDPEGDDCGLTGHLLCAVPQLLDPNFHRSVVFMLDHGEQGALGLVLNHPMNKTIEEVAQSLSLAWVGDPEARVRVGGPVEQIRGWFLHTQPEWDSEASEVLDGLWMTTSLEAVDRGIGASFGSEDGHFMFLLGYAGWAGGQLEAEIAAGSWVVIPVVKPDTKQLGVDIEFLFDCDPDDMWRAALASIGVDPQRLVGMQGSQALH